MARIYVGNLPLDIRSKDIEDLFWKYGRIRDVDLKNLSRPPAFAFVSFERYEDAEDAIRGRDGVMFEGQRLRVEMSKGSADVLGSSGAYGAPDRRDDRYGSPPRTSVRAPPPRDLRRSEFRVIVSGLPPSVSWQDLKDHCRPAGDVIYTDVDRQGGGIVEFANKADQEYAIAKLDDTELKKAFIRVKKPKEQMTESDRSRSRERQRDRDRRARKTSRSRSRSRSTSRSDRRRGRGGDEEEERGRGKDDRDGKGRKDDDA